MAILLTGGTGKTSVHLASLISSTKTPYLLTSRRGPSASTHPTITLDWNNPSTFENPFTYTFPTGEKITAVYLVAGDLAEPGPALNAFVDKAIAYGVRRFVLCAGSSAEPGGVYHGTIWQHLLDTGVEWCVLRPSWFMENFSEKGQGHKDTIIRQGKIYSACGYGKIPFVSARDIAAVAYEALMAEKAPNVSYRILGPRLMTYDQIAETLSKGLGREITHVRLSPEQRIESFVDAGIPEHMAGILTYLETAAADGEEELTGDDVETVTGKKPLDFEEFAQENKAVWA